MLEYMKCNKVYVLVGSILVVFFIATVCAVGFKDSSGQPSETADSSPTDFAETTPEVTEKPTPRLLHLRSYLLRLSAVSVQKARSGHSDIELI